MPEHPSDPAATPAASKRGAIESIIEPAVRDLGGFEVHRVLPAPACRSVGPFVFIDEMGPVVLPAGSGIDVRPHPHIGLATVTWLLEGQLLHRDSLGHEQLIRPGELNWMTAGRGIVHSERTPIPARSFPSPVRGLQTWVALPGEHEECAPSFAHFTAAQLPVVETEGARIVLVAGSAWGASSPVTTLSSLIYADIQLPDQCSLRLPDGFAERALYLLDGTLIIDDRPLEPGRLVLLRGDETVRMVARGDCRLMFLGGEPLDGPRFVWWNFVSSSRARIEQAKQDWKMQRFPSVPGETEFIPLPD